MFESTVNHTSKHLKENELNEKITQCLFCGSTNLKNVALIQKNPDVSMLECMDCRGLTASRIPKDEVISAYYNDYYLELSPDVKNITFDNDERFAKHILNSINLGDIQNIKILDFGGGDGTISKSIANLLLKNDTNNKIKKIHIDLVEISAVAKSSEANRVTVRTSNSLSELEEKNYDIVIASAIIEHLPSPANDFYDLFDRVAVGGYYYARTPYLAAFLKLFAAVGIKLNIYYPAHIHDLGDRFWNNTPSLIKKKLNKDFNIVKSQPSIVQTELNKDFMATVIAYTLKAPWYFLTKRYKFVGGWEIFLQRR